MNKFNLGEEVYYLTSSSVEIGIVDVIFLDFNGNVRYRIIPPHTEYSCKMHRAATQRRKSFFEYELSRTKKDLFDSEVASLRRKFNTHYFGSE